MWADQVTLQSKPIAVLISDIHFTVPTLELASQSLLKAQFKAVTLGVPLIIAGDTLDSKAVMRAECVNALLRLLAVKDAPKTYILVGNHDMCNEKGEDHALQFLHGFNTVTVVDRPTTVKLDTQSVQLIPYQSDLDMLTALINDEDCPEWLVMHQGVQTAYMGHYQQDKTSAPKELFQNKRVISGHYHRRQDIKCGRPRKGGIGLFSFIGNPYTLSFGEANDPEKGFQILHDSGLLEFVPTNLRKHVILDLPIEVVRGIKEIDGKVNIKPEDLLWVKITGPESELKKLNKQELGKRLIGHSNFKLELIPLKSDNVLESASKQQPGEILDNLIDSMAETVEQKSNLKSLWRSLINV